MNTSKCGSVAGWFRHYRAGEAPCGPCRDAWNVYYRDKGRLRRRTTMGPCAGGCGTVIQLRGKDSARCRACHRPLRAARKRSATRRANLERKAARAARGTVGTMVLTEGPCNWCGERFLARQAARFCSRRCLAVAAKHRRRAREMNARGEFTWSQVMKLYAAFNNRCAYCREPIVGALPEPDHVVPLSRGGDNHIGNILPSCKVCNSSKRDLLLHEWAADRSRRNMPPLVTSWTTDDPLYRHITSTQPLAPTA